MRIMFANHPLFEEQSDLGSEISHTGRVSNDPSLPLGTLFSFISFVYQLSSCTPPWRGWVTPRPGTYNISVSISLCVLIRSL